jgi:hypothetical protein
MNALRVLVAAALLLLPAAAHAQAPQAQQGWSLPPPGYTFQQVAPCLEDPVKAVKPLRPGAAVYSVCEDQMALLAKAIEQARAERKLLIVTVGATWCPWCAALQKAMPGPEFFGRKGDKLDYRATFNHLEIGVSTTHQGRNTVIPSGMAAERHLRARSGGVEIKSIPFIIVLDPNQPERVFARNSMDISDLTTGRQDMGRFRAVIEEAHAFLGSGKRAAAR